MSANPIVSPHCPPRTVVVGVDFGDASARALALAGVVAAGANARLVAVHAERFEPPAYFTMEQIARLETERHLAQAAAIAQLARFAAEATTHPVEPVVADAPPVEALLNQAATADLIVLGTHGRRGPGRWWLGSVAERIARAATVPVLVTRAADTPPRGVFERLSLVGEDGDTAAARSCAEELARLAGGRVTAAGPLARCNAGAVRDATLVVVAVPGGRPSWGFTDAVAGALGACDHPVLFVRAR
jgi:nucleotide-binding universal stress UspA family protein